MAFMMFPGPHYHYLLLPPIVLHHSSTIAATGLAPFTCANCARAQKFLLQKVKFSIQSVICQQQACMADIYEQKYGEIACQMIEKLQLKAISRTHLLVAPVY